MNLFDLAGKTAVVTGGTRGIGLMISRGLLQAGAQKLYISSRKAEGCAEAERELAEFGQVTAIQADLSTEAECLRLAREVGEQEQALHILVNNAGATWGAPLEEFPASAWDKILDLNLKSPFFLTRAFLPLLEAAGTHDDPARVMNIRSIDGLRVPSLPTYSYSASKAWGASHDAGARQGTRPQARHRQRRGTRAVRVQDDGRHPQRLRRCDRSGRSAAADRPARRHGRSSRVPVLAGRSLCQGSRPAGGRRDRHDGVTRRLTARTPRSALGLAWIRRWRF